MFSSVINGHTMRTITQNYEDAVKTLNTLQSNAAYIEAAKMNKSHRKNSLEETKKYLLRSGITWDQLDTLSVIHVTGTKGKGSTCAFSEAILREHGYHTGFFSSPHLVTVRERFRIDGQPISEVDFTHYFWKVYNTLNTQKKNDTDMPQYFKFLTIMMFHIFLESDLDVSIIEVGIGGEHDCTNVIRNPVCTGITKLGMDHMTLLGNTLEEISFHKAGIFKPNAPAFTVPQLEEAMKVLRKRAAEKNCTLSVVQRLEDYPWGKSAPISGISWDVQKYNASLAIELTNHFIMNSLKSNPMLKNEDLFDSKAININDECVKESISKKKLIGTPEFFEKVTTAISKCKWAGRTQILRGRIADFFLDGAHTFESIESCIAWFEETTKDNEGKRFLVFNTTGNRNSKKFLAILRRIKFDKVYFVPNVTGFIEKVDHESKSKTLEEQKLRCRYHCDIWGEGSTTAEHITEVFNLIAHELRTAKGKPKVLITGSLYLVGTALTVLDPDLTMKTHL